MVSERRPVVILVEKRLGQDLLYVALAAVFALGAIGGVRQQPISLLLLAVSAGLIVAVVRGRMRPTPFLTISGDEIAYGRVDEPGTVIDFATTDGRLEIHYGARSGAWLVPAITKKPSIALGNFDERQVRAACLDHGWIIER